MEWYEHLMGGMAIMYCISELLFAIMIYASVVHANEIERRKNEDQSSVS